MVSSYILVHVYFYLTLSSLIPFLILNKLKIPFFCPRLIYYSTRNVECSTDDLKWERNQYLCLRLNKNHSIRVSDALCWIVNAWPVLNSKQFWYFGFDNNWIIVSTSTLTAQFVLLGCREVNEHIVVSSVGWDTLDCGFYVNDICKSDGP